MKKAANNKILIWIAAIVIIVVAAVGVFILYGPKSPNSTTGSSPGGGGSNTNTGASTPLMTQSQANSLIGVNGSYKESTGTGAPASVFASILGAMANFNIAAEYTNSITATWGMADAYIPGSTSFGTVEFAFESSNPTGLYAYLLHGLLHGAQNSSSSTATFSTINGSSNGLFIHMER